jgi:sulfopyruvate decarboxylase subunit alpha
LQATRIIDALKSRGVTHVVGLPDNGSRTLFEALWADDDIEVVSVTREGEAYAVASGLMVGGATPIVLIQNTGFLETGDAFRGTCYNMGLPLVMLVGYRGFQTMEPGAERVDTAATFFEPTLKAWDIPYTLMSSDADVEPQIAGAFETAAQRSLPSAVLIVGTTT